MFARGRLFQERDPRSLIPPYFSPSTNLRFARYISVRKKRRRGTRISLPVLLVSVSIFTLGRAFTEDPESPGAGVPAAPVAASPAPVQGEEVVIESVNLGTTPMMAMPDWNVKTFRVPAARSLILSREGVPLAVNRVGRRLVIQLAGAVETAEEAYALVQRVGLEFDRKIPLLKLSEAEVRKHFENRPWIPLAISAAIPDSLIGWMDDPLPQGCVFEPLYIREYPQGELTAHLTGYIGVSLPDQRGPIGKVEYAWPPTEGRAGMEVTLDQQIRGRDGEVLRLYDPDGVLRYQEIVREPEAGKTLVLSINFEMQRLAKEQLERSGRPGAFVAVDADTGDILAMVSHPSFDPNLFEGGISTENFAALAEGKEAPLFDRAVTGAYPPGSTFKPFVALAGMEAGQIIGTSTRFTGPSALLVDGRFFKNWSSQSFGPMDVRYAIVSSCNTWFYQAALNTGAGPIADISARFGLGVSPALPLPSIATGNIPQPEGYSDPRSLANFAIGQGQVLASPVQMAFAMAALANGEVVPQPRLILRTHDPKFNHVVSSTEPEVGHLLRLKPEDIELVRDGMWGVVNSSGGTAGNAAMGNPVVYGKTGTSEWSVGGQMRSLAWFTGWVDATNPRIAFAAVTQGRGRETLSGGRSAAPIAAGVLRKVYGEPDTFAVTMPEGPSRPRPVIIPAEVIPELVAEEIWPRGSFGGLLRFIFGGGR